MKNRLYQKVGDNLDLRVIGVSRTHDYPWPIGRFIEDLLRMAEDRDGAYGPENKPVSKDMTVRQLLDWHSDYRWTIQ